MGIDCLPPPPPPLFLYRGSDIIVGIQTGAIGVSVIFFKQDQDISVPKA